MALLKVAAQENKVGEDKHQKQHDRGNKIIFHPPVTHPSSPYSLRAVHFLKPRLTLSPNSITTAPKII